jgi:hypothetical protein
MQQVGATGSGWNPYFPLNTASATAKMPIGSLTSHIATSGPLLRIYQVQNGAAPRHFALPDAVLACKLTPEQYNFSHSELEKGDS